MVNKRYGPSWCRCIGDCVRRTLFGVPYMQTSWKRLASLGPFKLAAMLIAYPDDATEVLQIKHTPETLKHVMENLREHC